MDKHHFKEEDQHRKGKNKMGDWLDLDWVKFAIRDAIVLLVCILLKTSAEIISFMIGIVIGDILLLIIHLLIGWLKHNG